MFTIDAYNPEHHQSYADAKAAGALFTELGMIPDTVSASVVKLVAGAVSSASAAMGVSEAVISLVDEFSVCPVKELLEMADKDPEKNIGELVTLWEKNSVEKSVALI